MERVLCIFSVLVEVSDSQEAAQASLDEVSTAVLVALQGRCARMEYVKTQDIVEFVWLDRPPECEHMNIHTCVVCGRLGTDWMQPNIAHGIREGFCEQGGFICDNCREVRFMSELGNGPSETPKSVSRSDGVQSQFHVREQSPMAAKYGNLIAMIREAGFFVTAVESMGDWDRITVCSKRRASGSYAGNSFWLSCLATGWYVGAWGGMRYRIAEEKSVGKFCIEWLGHEGHELRPDFDNDFKRRFGLVEVSEDEFDSAAGNTIDPG